MSEIGSCRADNGELIPLIDLGEQYLADFREDDSRPPKHPLELCMCVDCKLVQLKHTTPQEEMYHERYGFKSGVSNSIKEDLKSIVDNALTYKPDARRWLDIASNDGTLLSFVPKDIRREGIDPITKYCRQAELHADRIVNDYFADHYFHYIMGEGEEDLYEPFDVVTSISMFYDIPDPNEFVRGVKSVLAKDGVWIIQQNYILPTIELGAIDNICHEHLEYYSLLSLENLLRGHGLEVFDLSTSMVNGGSFRTLVARKGEFPIQDSVERQRTIELDAGLNTPEAYLEFSRLAEKKLRKLGEFVFSQYNSGKNTYILGASTRGGTLWQGAGLTKKELPYAIERNPEKVGKYMSSIGSRIISERRGRQEQPDYMIVSPWFFEEEITAREQEYLNRGGKLIYPLPELKVVSQDGEEII